jgi:pantothenate kinase
MDGFHYPQSTLNIMPNKAEAYVRRGVDWTFDAPKLIDFLQHLRCSKTDSKVEILAPGFDYTLKVPKTDAIRIGPKISLVILKGSWLLLDQES